MLPLLLTAALATPLAPLDLDPPALDGVAYLPYAETTLVDAATGGLRTWTRECAPDLQVVHRLVCTEGAPGAVDRLRTTLAPTAEGGWRVVDPADEANLPIADGA